MSSLFTKPDAWNGGFFELLIELPDNSPNFARQVLAKLWSSSMLDGPYRENKREPEQQEKRSALDMEQAGHGYGIARLPNEKQTCCGTYWGDYDDHGCWISFYLPLGSFADAYQTGSYPFGEDENAQDWMVALQDWLVLLAREVHPVARFEIAITGFEVDFFAVKEQVKNGMPAERWDGILLAQHGQLLWFPPTIYHSPYSTGKHPE